MKLPVLRRVLFFVLVGACLTAFAASNASAQYTATNLVSNATYLSPQTPDSSLINAWGLAAFPTSPFWVSAQNSSTSRLYTGSGSIFLPLPFVDIPCVTDMTDRDTMVPCPVPGLFEPLNGCFLSAGEAATCLIRRGDKS